MSPAGKKILIADDDASIRLVLSQSFTRLGYQVRATGNASTLLKWVSEGEGDLVITDVMMPGGCSRNHPRCSGNLRLTGRSAARQAPRGDCSSDALQGHSYRLW